MAIETRYDKERGCGWRQPGGLYLVADGPGMACGTLPIPLGRCPSCDGGIKPTRSWTWIDAAALIANRGTCAASPNECGGCPLRNLTGRHGLLWIGGRFYPTPEAWTQEAMTQGVSRRISTLPKGFVVGETWALVAHRQAMRGADGELRPAIFHAFQPSAVEYVVRGDESEDALARLHARGITPVRVVRDES